MSRLDFFLISNDLQFGIDSCENLCLLSGDHSPVKVKLWTDLADDRGRGCWKLNSSLVENNQFVFDMKNKINEISSTCKDFDNPRVNWEYLKFKMK